MSERTSSLDSRLFSLQETVSEEIDRAVTENINEICEAVGRVYDEYPRDLSQDEEAYSLAAGARLALHSLLKELDIDPESVREGWE